MAASQRYGRRQPKTYSRVEESSADSGKDGDVDGQGESECQADIQKLCEVDISRVDVVFSVGGIRVGDLGCGQCHQQEQECSNSFSGDLNGMKPEVFNKVVTCHDEV